MISVMMRLLRRLIYLLLFLLIALVGLVIFSLQDSPNVAAYSPPSAEDVVAARGFVRDVKAALDPAQPADRVRATEAELNSVIKLGARLIPGFRGAVTVDGQTVMGRMALPVPYIEGQWINLSATVPAFEAGLDLSDVTLGPLQLPPKVTLGALRLASRHLLGAESGDKILDAAEALQINGTQLTFVMNSDQLGASGSNGMMRALFGALSGGNPPAPEDIGRYYQDLRLAMDRGDLPTEGSYLPYLHFTLNAAQEGAKTDGINKAYTAALFALTLTCGARDFTLVTGGLADAISDVERPWRTECNALTLNGRIDSRRHFTTAAAIQAASNSGVAVSIGEFKELYDSQKAGGFDFTDIAANNSGIRMSNRLMGAPVGDWPALLARLSNEGDVIISYEGIPQILSEAAFKARFGDVEDPRYQAMLAQIEAKIDGLALHQE
jgi:hypothetical protein